MGSYDPDQTAYAENHEEIIYHLDLEPESVSGVEDHFATDRDELTCDDFGDRADWYVGEIRRGGPRNDLLYCDDCIPGPYMWLWEDWPWTPDDDL